MTLTDLAAPGALARRLAHVDAELRAVQKKIVNRGLELAGCRLLQRLAVEIDAQAHLSRDSARTSFGSYAVELRLKAALRNRDAPLGYDRVRLCHAGGRNAPD